MTGVTGEDPAKERQHYAQNNGLCYVADRMLMIMKMILTHRWFSFDCSRQILISDTTGKNAMIYIHVAYMVRMLVL